MPCVSTVCASYRKIIVSYIFPKLCRKFYLVIPLCCTITEGASSLSTFPFGLSYFCGPALSFYLITHKIQSTHGPLGLFPDMKHKRKKSSKCEHKYKKKHRKKAKRKETQAIDRLKHLAMASGFQGTMIIKVLS